MRVKLCGITRYEDAFMALDLGVDALGFNFYTRSPRYIAPEEARAIVRRLPPLTTTVGVFVNAETPGELERIALLAGVQVLQLHGDESPAFCRHLARWPLIKALRIGAAPIDADLGDFEVQAFLLDAPDHDRFGGTGKTFDWNQAIPIKRLRPIILAGGLRAGNVATAIRTVRPYGIDVCSGVERRPGEKDRTKVVEFMKEVIHAASNLSDEDAARTR